MSVTSGHAATMPSELRLTQNIVFDPEVGGKARRARTPWPKPSHAERDYILYMFLAVPNLCLKWSPALSAPISLVVYGCPIWLSSMAPIAAKVNVARLDPRFAIYTGHWRQ